jgi:hypothetical protein
LLAVQGRLRPGFNLHIFQPIVHHPIPVIYAAVTFFICLSNSSLPQSLTGKVSHGGLFLLRYEAGDYESDPRRITF